MTRIVLAYAGSADDTCAIAWLAGRHGAEVSAVTLDLGQEIDPGAMRERALGAGARRAHVIDAREAFARDCILPALTHGVFAAAIRGLAHPLIARTLVEVAAIEDAPALAHGAAGPHLHEVIAALAGGRDVLAPAAEWTARGIDPRAYARSRGVHVAAAGAPAANLIVRRAPLHAAAADLAAHVNLAFEAGVPVSINGVPLALPELLDSLSLIASQHGIAASAAVHAPAADVLQAAYAALAREAGEVRLRLLNGDCTVLAVHDRSPQLVTHA